MLSRCLEDKHINNHLEICDFTFTFHEHLLHAEHPSFMHWRRKWQPTPVFLSCPGTGEPGGLLSMGSHRVRHD